MITKDWIGSVAGYDLVVKPNKEKLNSLWLTEYLLEDEVQNYFKSESVRSAQPHLNSQQLGGTLIPHISIENQSEVSKKLLCFHRSIESIEKQIENQKFLNRTFINKIF